MIFHKINIYEKVIHAAYESGNMELVEYLATLKKVNVNAKNILIF